MQTTGSSRRRAIRPPGSRSRTGTALRLLPARRRGGLEHAGDLMDAGTPVEHRERVVLAGPAQGRPLEAEVEARGRRPRGDQVRALVARRGGADDAEVLV